MCANEEMAIEILEFIKRNYEKHLNEDGQVGCQKYIEALQMGIDALKKDNNDADEGFYDDIGGYHEAGMGWNPNGNWCGECSQSTCRECPNKIQQEN